jgi:hypothetical protein
VPAASRRGRRVRWRRLLALAAAAAAAAVVVILVAPTSHHVHVVRVVTLEHRAPKDIPSATGGGPASAQAPSTQQVEKELHQAEAASTGVTEVESGGSNASPLSSRASASFSQLQRSLPEHVAVAVAPLGSRHVEVLGGDQPAHGWSTTKVPVLAALIKARGARGLTATEQGWATSAITASDNGSILSLFGDLERIRGGLVGASRYIEGLFRLSGDTDTVVATASPPAGAVTTFGQTLWTPSASVKFFSALARGCLLSTLQTSYVLGLMQNIESSESWGLGSAGFRAVAFKGGWGPDAGGYLVRQAGIVNVGSPRAVAVAIVAYPSGSASFSSGVQTLSQTAVWLRHNLRPGASGSRSCSAG